MQMLVGFMMLSNAAKIILWIKEPITADTYSLSTVPYLPCGLDKVTRADLVISSVFRQKQNSLEPNYTV